MKSISPFLKWIYGCAIVFLLLITLKLAMAVYTPPSYSSVGLILNGSYTPPSYGSVNLVLGGAGPSSTCICPGVGSDWEINEECVITVNCNITTGEITFDSVNTFNVSAGVIIYAANFTPNADLKVWLSANSRLDLK